MILLGEGEAAEAKRRLLERAGGGDRRRGGARRALAFVALDDARARSAARLKARGMLVNVVDRPDLCDFTLPAIVDRDPVLVAVGTGGASAGLAAALRQRLEALLPAELGGLAGGAARLASAMRGRWPDAGRAAARDRRGARGGPLDPLARPGRGCGRTLARRAPMRAARRHGARSRCARPIPTI